jgi:hypothetical protein
MGTTIAKERTCTELMNWTLLDDKGSATPYVDSGQVDISSDILCILHISMAQCNTTAIAATPTVKVWGSSGSTADDWNLITELGYGTTPSGKIDMSKGITSGEYSCGIGDTSGAETWGQTVFFCHTTFTSSMINVVRDWSNDSAMFFLNPATTDFTTGTDLLCPTGGTLPGVLQWNVEVPDGFWAAKVSFHNPDDDANFACRVQYTKVTDLTAS